MDRIITVLNKGYIRLVDSMGDDLSVVRAARVSHDNDTRTGFDFTGDEKLIRYLAKHQHRSPFEHVVFTFEVSLPIFVARQWMRHRTWSYNEVSARYSEVEDDFYVPEADMIGRQGTANKQARWVDGPASPEAHEQADDIFRVCASAVDAYKRLLNTGVPRELARTVLPQAMYTRMYATVDLSNLDKFIHLRSHEGAQWEIQQYADALLKLAKEIAPLSVNALMEQS